jgi:hypothetical protein
MKYEQKSFNVMLGSKEYRDNYEKIFGKKAAKKSNQEAGKKKKDQSNGEEVPTETN